MKHTGFSARVWLGLLIFLLCHHELSAMTELDAERIRLGVKAAQSVASAMKALKFVSWVSKIGGVAGPLLSVALMAVEIVFSFLNIDSPEMIVMKQEFKVLNTRMDEFSEKFQDVKKKIDWAAIQTSYESYESAIDVMTEQRLKLVNAKTAADRDAAARIFMRKYENDFPMISEKFYYALIADSGFTTNIFDASRKYSDQHPEHTFAFMKGCVQLLLQSIAVQGTYIRLKYKSSSADEYFKILATEKMQNVAKKATSVYDAMRQVWHTQMEKDIKRIALTNRHLSHKDFSGFFYRYIVDKYTHRRWFVFVYNELSSYNKHATYTCGGGLYYRLGGRNIVLGSYDRYANNAWSTSWAKDVLNSIPQFRQDSDTAKGLLDKVIAKNGDCSPAKTIAIVGYGADAYKRAWPGETVSLIKSVKWCNDPLCLLGEIRKYSVTMFG